MGKFFKNNVNTVDKNSTEYAVQQYLYSRNNILWVLILSAINIACLFIGLDYYFLFSSTIAYFATIDLIILFGFSVGIAFCIGVLALYLLCWLKAKTNTKWMITATVIFALDCFTLIFYILMSGTIIPWLLDIVFHVFIMLSLINGVRRIKKYNEYINGEIVSEKNNDEISDNTDIIENTENIEQN